MSDLVGNPNCWFSHAKAHLYSFFLYPIYITVVLIAFVLIDASLMTSMLGERASPFALHVCFNFSILFYEL